MRSAERQAVWDSTGGLCFYCQTRLVDDAHAAGVFTGAELLALMQTDHKTPVSRGGKDRPSNRAPACGVCNAQKSNRTAEEYRAYLLQHGVLARFFGERAAARDWMPCSSFPRGGANRFDRFNHPAHVWGRGR